jgi:hypothetical protein
VGSWAERATAARISTGVNFRVSHGISCPFTKVVRLPKGAKIGVVTSYRKLRCIFKVERGKRSNVVDMPLTPVIPRHAGLKQSLDVLHRVFDRAAEQFNSRPFFPASLDCPVQPDAQILCQLALRIGVQTFSLLLGNFLAVRLFVLPEIRLALWPHAAHSIASLLGHLASERSLFLLPY